jgi:hypothetical protein
LLQVVGGQPSFTGGNPATPFAAGVASVPGTTGFTAVTIERSGAFSVRQWWALDLGDGSNGATRAVAAREFADYRRGVGTGVLTITAQELGARTYASIGARSATLSVYDDPADTVPVATYTISHTVRCCRQWCVCRAGGGRAPRVLQHVFAYNRSAAAAETHGKHAI